MEGGDMDSLFEGMVLFNPAQIEIEVAAENNQQDNDPVDDSQSDAAASSSSCSQPLDENIFSDLTLIVDPLQNLQVTEDHLLQSQSWQHHHHHHHHQQVSSSSRRRKRSGLRIGYGRNRDAVDVDVDVDPSPPAPPPLPPLPISDSPSLPTDVAAAAVDVVTQQPSIASASASESITTADDDDDVATTATASASESIRHTAADDDKEEAFRQIRKTIHEKLNHARQLVNSASAVRKDAIRSRRKAVENANLASLKYMELEMQLEEACEAEDFERAEKVSELLSAAEKEKQISANSLKQADAFIDALDLKLQHALHSHIAAEEECAILLHHYATTALTNSNN
ncbi:hypothetical protein TSUD_115620 [Trifolium subterraneum]|uniref:UVR domain-containing protein n=1 Tax=Trifolium subterraneum TaxID=3900 RepID=A0A2Z6N0I8_TRISU|nr:hypothetical protein TSUD_115620 [Trifolium subterraneum]